jgi:hypothetical protein
MAGASNIGPINIASIESDETITPAGTDLVPVIDVSDSNRLKTSTVTNIATGGSGVAGPESSTDNAIAKFDGTDGGTIQNSGVTISDNDIVSAKGLAQTVQALTDGATISFNMNNGYIATVSVAGSRTMAAPTNATAGTSGSITFTTDGTARTITWNAAYRFAGGGTTTVFGVSTVNKVYWETADGTNFDCGVKYGMA